MRLRGTDLAERTSAHSEACSRESRAAAASSFALCRGLLSSARSAARSSSKSESVINDISESLPTAAGAMAAACFFFLRFIRLKTPILLKAG
jgi:hypothetical protein